MLARRAQRLYSAEVSADLDLAQLRACALAYLAWEEELSGFGVPVFELPTVARAPEGAPLPREAHREPPAREAAASQPREATRDVPALPAVPPTDLSPPEEVRASMAAHAHTPTQPVADRRLRLAELEQEVRSCTRCELAKGRTQTVFARGNPESPLVFIGEGPGQEEDRLGSPFVGPAGQLLDKMVAAMGFGRDDVYICNVVKCRPPGNRTPLPSEAGACSPYLLGQLDAVAPRVIVALGRCATENLGLVGAGGGWRGRWGKFQGVDVMPTYHPAFLLRSPEFKRPVWEDLQKVIARLKQGA